MRRIALISAFFALVLITIRATAQTFTEVGDVTIPLTNAKAEWVDFNNDELLDLFVAGTDGSSINRVIIYANNGDNTFTGADLVNLGDIAYDFGDYDKDGFIDILIAGRKSSGSKVFTIYKNNEGGSFSAQNFNLTPFSKGGVVWVDLDHDTDLDIIASGLNEGGDEVALVYEFDGTSFNTVANSITPLSRGKVEAFDANNDGVLEVLISGLNNLGSAKTIIYSVDDNLNTSIYSDVINGYSENSIAFADYNEDGFVDFALTGNTATLDKASNLYQNNQTNGFVRINQFMDSTNFSSIDLGDLNNDGLVDIVLTGIDKNNDSHFYYYQNDGGGSYTFSEITNSLEAIYAGDVALGDFNNDGGLDIYQIGNSSVSTLGKLWESDLTSNNPPDAPTNLASITDEDTVLLSWDAITDDFTSTSSLTYNIYISKTSGGSDLVVSPGSDIGTGYRRTTGLGNTGFKTEIALHGLPEGNYFWSVQAIDNSFNGSQFGAEGSFTICYSFDLGGDTAICKNESIQLTAGKSGDVVNWHSLVEGLEVESNSLTYNHLVTQRDTLVAELTKSAYGCTRYDTIVVDMLDLPDFDLGEDTVICYGQHLNLSVTGFDSVNWLSTKYDLLSSDSNLLDYEVLEKDTIIVEFFNANRCVNYDSLIVNTSPLPVYDLGADTAICYGSDLELSVTGFDSANWYSTSSYPNLLSLDSKSLTYKVLEKDTIIVEFYNTNGCVNYDSLIVEVLDLPVFDLGNDTTICFREFLTLNVSGFDSVNWYSTLLTPSLLSPGNNTLNYEALEKDTIITEVYNASGCVSYDSLIVNVFPLPEFNLGNDTSICYNESILLQLPNASFTEINWYAKSNGALLLENNWFLDYTVTTTDTIIAEVYNNNGCLNYDTIAIAMNPLPDYDITNQSVCFEDSITLTIPGAWEEVNWYTAGNQLLEGDNSTYQFKVEETIMLWSEVYNSAGCVDYDTFTVTMLPLPEFELGEDRVYCFGDEALFDVGDIGEAYEWTNTADDMVSSENSWSYAAIQSDSLFLTVTSVDNCDYSDSLKVTVNPLPEFVIAGSSEICAGDTTNLSIDFPSFSGISWFTPLHDSIYTKSLDFAYSPDSSTWLYAGLTDGNQCGNLDSVFVTVNERPEALAGEDLLICYGDETELGGVYSGIDGLNFSWYPSATLSAGDISNPVASPGVPTTYYLEVTDTDGCNSFDTVYVEVNPEITVDAGPDVSVCQGDSVKIGGDPTASGSQFEYTYSWSPGEGISSLNVSNPTVAPDTDQQYVVAVSSGDCMVEYDTVNVTVNYAPKIRVSQQQSVGPDESVQLFAEGGISYSWTPSELLDDPTSPTPLASPLETTLFEVLITDGNGCDSVGYVNVLVRNVIFIPNLFTPNGDGSNDYFKVFGSGIASIRFAVYDLNGNPVFEATTIEKAQELGWDGTSNGTDLPNGTYVWTLEGKFHNGSDLGFAGKKKGTIRLIR